MILMDHLMPGMSGEDTFRRIRQESSLNRYTPVVILTAEDSEEYRRSIREQGLSGYILKPVTLPAVMEALLQAGVRGGAKR
jgi:CheY-like chemotaxis protein